MVPTTKLGTKFGGRAFSVLWASFLDNFRPLERFGGLTMRELCGLHAQNSSLQNSEQAPAMRISRSPLCPPCWIDKSIIFVELPFFFEILQTPDRKPPKIVGTSARVTFFSYAECDASHKKTNSRRCLRLTTIPSLAILRVSMLILIVFRRTL